MLNNLRTYGRRLPFARSRRQAEAPSAPPPQATAYPRREYPSLTRKSVAGARLFADREDMIEAVGAAHGQRVAEVGVAMGDFSEIMLQKLSPEQFVAVDLFGLHELTEIWGRSTRSIFGDLTHGEYYRQRFSSYGDSVVVEEGLSWEVLARYPDEHFDLIYVDAAHDYDGVKLDAEQAVKKVKPDGVLVFNDYIMYDHLLNVPYGVVQNVNELVAHQGWHVLGFAFQTHMFCDIALSRQPAAT